MTPKEKIEALYEGIAFFYPGLVYGPDAPTNSQDKIKYEGRTVSKKEFLNIVFEFTKTNDINLALKKLLELREAVDEIRPEEQPDRTTPQNLEELVEREEKEKARAKKARGRVRRPAKTEQVAEQIKTATETSVVLEGKVIYAEPKDATKKVPPTPQEEYVLKKLTESAIKNRRVFVTKLSEQIVKNAPLEIRKNIPPEQLELSAKRIALDFSERLINKTPVAPPGVFASIADPATNLEKIIPSPPAVEQIREAGVTFSAISERSDFTTRTLLYPVLGENVTSLVYGPAQETYILTFEPTDKTAYTVNLSELHENATNFRSGPVYQSINNPLLDIARDRLFSFGKNTIVSELNNLPKEGALGFISRFSSSGTFDGAISLLAGSQTQYVASKISGKIVMALLPTHTRIIVGISNFLKLDLGLVPMVAGAVPTTAVTTGILTTKAIAAGAAKPVAAKIAGGAVSTAIGKGVTAVAIKLGLSATLAQTLGTVLPIIGHAIGFVLGTLVQKLAGWLKKNPDTAIGVGAAVLVGGLLVQSPVLIIGGAAALAVGGFARGALTVGVVAGGILLFGRRLGKSLAVTVGLPIIVMIAVTPIIVYFILFIINSGAYIVPPGPATFGGIPPGGNLTKCDPNETGAEITEQLAASMESGSVRFLPDSLGSRMAGMCMTPIMIVLHTSGGYDNDDGNSRTYETLVSRDLSCQLATDTDDTILMLSFFEKQVEYPWCANNLDAGGVSIEMAGECQGGCAHIAKCSPNTSLTYTPTGPHPCPNLENLAFSAICKVMQKYKIPWSQVFQHEASNGTHDDPIGDEWVNKFILRLKSNCQI